MIMLRGMVSWSRLRPISAIRCPILGNIGVEKANQMDSHCLSDDSAGKKLVQD